MKLTELKLTPPHLLLYGPFGTGKTALMSTLGERIQIFDMDNGMKTALKLKDQFQETRMKVDVEQFLETDPTRATAFLSVKTKMFEVASKVGKGTYPFPAWGLDSLSALMDSAMRYVLANNGGLGQAPQIQHWGMAFKEVLTLMELIRSLNIVVVVCAHDQRDVIDNATVTEIMVPGKNLPNKIPGFFDEVYYCRQMPAAGGKNSYVLQTVSTPSVRARTREQLKDNTDQNLGLVEILRQIGYTFPERKEVTNVQNPK